MKTRHSSQARIYDTKRWTLVFDLYGRGGMFFPVIHLHHRGKNGSVAGFGPKWSKTLKVPHLRWAKAHERRDLGGMRAYQAQDRAFRRIFTGAPR